MFECWDTMDYISEGYSETVEANWIACTILQVEVDNSVAGDIYLDSIPVVSTLCNKDHLYRMVLVEVQQYLTKPNHCI